MGPLGWQETAFIFVLALLIFGPKKLPELGKTIGKAMTEFRRASSELKSTWDREMAAIEREKESLNETTRSIQNEIDTSTQDYNSSYYDSAYDYGYGSDNYSNPESSGSNALEPANSSTVSASATEGAEQSANGTVESASAAAPQAAPEGTVARDSELAKPALQDPANA